MDIQVIDNLLNLLVYISIFGYIYIIVFNCMREKKIFRIIIVFKFIYFCLKGVCILKWGNN